MARESMTEADLIVRQLQRVHAGEPWHGPSRASLLADVDAAVAAWHPGAGAHSLWETVLHMRSWTDEVRERALGKRPDGTGAPVGGDWPEVRDTSEAAWRAACDSLQRAHERLVEAVRALPPERLRERVGATPGQPAGSGISVATMLRSLADHDLYHSGQVALLRRLARHALGRG